MKKVVQINSVCNGSTGKIMKDISLYLEDDNFSVLNFYGRGVYKGDKDNFIKFSSNFSVYFHLLLARLGLNGYGSYFATKKLIKMIKKFNPDVIHMHNIHGYYLNLKLFFKYLKNDFKGKIVWTLHDCWTFTGHCSYFDFAKCDKWKKSCSKCPIKMTYPKTYIDTSALEFKLKKELFLGLENLTFVTPSLWLKKLVKQSFFKDYNVQVVNNGINLNVFKKYDVKDLDTIYEKYCIPKDKHIILGVAGIWDKRKGIDDFVELSKVLESDYVIVLVGIDNKTSKILDNNIIKIARTENQDDLAKLYNIADVLFNPTHEDNYPTVNLEAVACGTPVVTYNTGGSSESMLGFGCIADLEDMKSNYKNIINNKYKYPMTLPSYLYMAEEYCKLYNKK